MWEFLALESEHEDTTWLFDLYFNNIIDNLCAIERMHFLLRAAHDKRKKGIDRVMHFCLENQKKIRAEHLQIHEFVVL
jgi:hypothetical protein